jgi:drug/metabolite transporter (DMT)-like permease
MMKQNMRSNLLLLIAVFIWGICIPLNKMVLATIPSIMLIWIELLVSVIFLFIYTLFRKQKFKLEKQYIFLFLVGLLEPGVAYYLEFLGMEKTSGLHASIILAFEPIGIIFFNIVLFKLSRDFRLILSNIFAVIGVLIVSYGTDGATEINSVAGDLIILAGTLAASLYVSITMRYSKSEDIYSMLFLQQLASLIFISIFTYSSAQVFLVTNNTSVLTVLAAMAIGLFQFGVAFLCYFKGSHDAGTYESVIVLCSTPIIAIFFSVLLLHETPNFVYFIGSLMVFLSIIYAHLREKLIEDN